MENKRFLEVDKSTPLLPLPDCTAQTCRCKYASREDRRELDGDRRHPSALQSELYVSAGNQNRRKARRGRRKSDWS